MNQRELVNALAREHDLPKDFSERIIKTILTTIIYNLKKGSIVRLRNFGSFQTRKSHGKTRVKFNDSDNIFRYYG